MAALVTYSDSESESGETPTVDRDALKRKAREENDNTLPGLPTSFLDLYATPVRTTVTDDPSLHGGRQRTNAHIQGNWPSHVYIEWRPAAEAANLLQTTIVKLQQSEKGTEPSIQSLLEDDFGAELPLHISLSRSLNLQSDQRQPFFERLSRAVKTADIKPFTVSLARLHWEANQERNRWFLTASASRPLRNDLNRLLSICNTVSGEFGQPALYSKKKLIAGTESNTPYRKRRKVSISTPDESSLIVDDMSDRFHVSIAWSLQEPNTNLKEMTERSQGFKDASVSFTVASVKVKIGNTIENLPLDGKASVRTSIIG